MFLARILGEDLVHLKSLLSGGCASFGYLCLPVFFLWLLACSILNIMPGSANFEIFEEKTKIKLLAVFLTK